MTSAASVATAPATPMATSGARFDDGGEVNAAPGAAPSDSCVAAVDDGGIATVGALGRRPAARSSSVRRTVAIVGRSSAFLASIDIVSASIAGSTPATTDDKGGGASKMCMTMSSPMPEPTNGGRPATS